jgi:hypothetical protein
VSNYNYCSPTLTNCIIYGNSATSCGGGLYNGIYSSPIVTNCTFYDNSAMNYGGGIHNEGFSPPTVTNCILWADSAPMADEIRGSVDSMPVVTYCDVQGGTGQPWFGTGCIDSDPCFVDAATGDFHLLSDSPCIDSGTNSAPNLPATDVDGDSRIVDGVVDIGADEFGIFYELTTSTDSEHAGTIALNPPGGYYLAGTEVTVTANAATGYAFGHWSGDLTGSANPETIIMDSAKTITAHFIGHQLTVSVDPAASGNVILEPPSGLYAHGTEVTVTANPAGGYVFDYWSGDLSGSANPNTILMDDNKTITAHFTFTGIIYVNDDANGANNGDSWANAFTDLQDALQAANAGLEIRVAAGTYKPTMGTDPNAGFQMKNGVGIYGGFAGDEDPSVFDLADRDFTTNETILSGDIGVVGNNADNCYHVIYNQQGTILDSSAILDGFTITGGNANGSVLPDYYGGGMLNEGAVNYPCSPTVTNCTFSGNTADYGGGMGNFDSNPTVKDCNFTTNYDVHDGGGMYNNNSSPTVTNCTFNGNTANYGGGMYNDNYSSPVVTDCNFTGNVAGGYGGGMRNNNSSPRVINCTFSGNRALGNYGGGVWNSGGSLTVTNCTFIGNMARIGAGIESGSGCTLTVTNCAFNGNSAVRYGGGMHNGTGTSSTVTGCTFSGNSAGNEGGGGMYNSDISTVTNCTFCGNWTNYRGGGMFNKNRSQTVTNCTFIGNSAGVDGGGMYNNYNTSQTVTNCTFSGNEASGNGGGMYNYSFSSQTVTNCILWGDEPDEIYNYNVSPTVTYSDVRGGWGDPNDPNNTNIDAAPRFVDANNPDPNLCNLRLQPDSPCIDAGDTTAVPGGIWADLGGNPRVSDDTKTPDTGISILGVTVDMGAYEFYCSVIPGDVNCDGVVDFKDLAILCGNWLAGTEPEF